VVLLV